MRNLTFVLLTLFSFSIYSQNTKETVMENSELMEFFNKVVNTVDSVGISYFEGWSASIIGNGFQRHYRKNKSHEIIYAYFYYKNSKTIRVTKGGFKSFFDDYGYLNNFREDYFFIYLTEEESQIIIKAQNEEYEYEILDTIPKSNISDYFTKGNPFIVAQDFYEISEQIGSEWHFKNPENYFRIFYGSDYTLMFFSDDKKPDKHIIENSIILKPGWYLYIPQNN